MTFGRRAQRRIARRSIRRRAKVEPGRRRSSRHRLLQRPLGQHGRLRPSRQRRACAPGRFGGRPPRGAIVEEPRPAHRRRRRRPRAAPALPRPRARDRRSPPRGRPPPAGHAPAPRRRPCRSPRTRWRARRCRPRPVPRRYPPPPRPARPGPRAQARPPARASAARAIGIERRRPHDPRPPPAVPQPSQRGDQHVMTLAGDQRADAQDQRRIARRARPGRGFGAGRRDGDPGRGDPEACRQPPAGGVTGADDRAGMRQRRRLVGQQTAAVRGAQPALVAERMVHQRHQPQPRRLRRELLGQDPAGEPVDQHRPRRPASRPAPRAAAARAAASGKRPGARERHVAHLPAQRGQLRRSAAGRSRSRRSACRLIPGSTKWTTGTKAPPRTTRARRGSRAASPAAVGAARRPGAARRGSPPPAHRRCAGRAPRWW